MTTIMRKLWTLILETLYMLKRNSRGFRAKLGLTRVNFGRTFNPARECFHLYLHQKAGAKILEIFDLLCREHGLAYWLGAGNYSA